MPVKLTKAERTRRTRRAILERARHLFAAQGYAATGTEEIIRELGITRGALYHQFSDKLGVFKAVVVAAYGEITDHIQARIQPLDNNWQQLIVGCQAFLEVAQQEDLRRLALTFPSRTSSGVTPSIACQDTFTLLFFFAMALAQ